MADYASDYTGQQIDENLSKAGYLDIVGKAPSAITADRLTINAGSVNTPIYFDGGGPDCNNGDFS